MPSSQRTQSDQQLAFSQGQQRLARGRTRAVRVGDFVVKIDEKSNASSSDDELKTGQHDGGANALLGLVPALKVDYPISIRRN